MPTYRFSCDHCGGGTERWLSIHHEASERPTVHDGCGGTLSLVITGVRTYGVGQRGAQTRSYDAREREIDRDRPAYKRLRDEGFHPRTLRGAAEIEARADDEWFINTGGAVSVPEERKDEINEMLAEGTTTSWSPIDAVHEQRSA